MTARYFTVLLRINFIAGDALRHVRDADGVLRTHQRPCDGRHLHDTAEHTQQPGQLLAEHTHPVLCRRTHVQVLLQQCGQHVRLTGPTGGISIGKHNARINAWYFIVKLG